MQAGLLTGAFTAARAKTLPADDWRSRNAEFTGDKLKPNLELAETMKAVGQRHGTGAASAAIAWTLAWPGVSGAIVGARDPSQVDGWIDAATLHLRQPTSTRSLRPSSAPARVRAPPSLSRWRAERAS